MRAVTAIRANMAAEKERHRLVWKRLRRELSEARGVRYTASKEALVKADYVGGVLFRTMQETHCLTKGQISGLAERRKWKRPWISLKTLSPTQRALYTKLRKAGRISRASAFAEVKKIPAASPVLPSAAPLGQMAERRPVAPCLPTVAPALNSEAADG